MKYLILSLLVSVSAAAQEFNTALVKYNQNMLDYGAKHCQTLKDCVTNFDLDRCLDTTYYDAERVYIQISEYTKDPKWLECAQAAKFIYRDKYVLPNGGNVPGFRNFTLGLTLDKEDKSKEAVKALADMGAFCRVSTKEDMNDPNLSRETSYCLKAYLNEEKIGLPERPRLQTLYNASKNHVKAWFVNKTATCIKPFMAALTAESFIKYYEQKNNYEAVYQVKTIADGLINGGFYNEASKSFIYCTGIDPSEGPCILNRYAQDLNLLIAPLFAFVYKEFKDQKYLDFGDKLFISGVNGAFLQNPKQFNQNYRWSLKYLEWRNSAPARVPPTATPSPLPIDTIVPTPAYTPTNTPIPTATATPIDFDCEKSNKTVRCTNYLLRSLRDIIKAK